MFFLYPMFVFPCFITTYNCTLNPFNVVDCVFCLLPYRVILVTTYFLSFIYFLFDFDFAPFFFFFIFFVTFFVFVFFFVPWHIILCHTVLIKEDECNEKLPTQTVEHLLRVDEEQTVLCEPF